MKKVIFILLTALTCSCSHKIADLNMVSNRNVDSKTDYVEIERYVKSKSTGVYVFGLLVKKPNIEDAVDKATAKTEKGEFLKNVTIHRKHMWYVIVRTETYKVKGDVWGKK